MTVVTRFAPSPTGFLHIGGARTALFNWLFAKHSGGRFLLRIEDTDRARFTDAAVEAIIDGMQWLGLQWDGEVVHQFARLQRHAEVAKQLLTKGQAYYCYASTEELQQHREAHPNQRFISTWREPNGNMPPTDTKPAIRLKTPQEGEVVVRDHVRGDVHVPATQLEDLVIVRADGTPTYNLAVVVDDHDMGVTHIIRGEDHLTNAAKQIVIYQAMSWDVPEFAHIPLIHGADGAKLSKRHGALGVDAYRDMGYLPEALRNYLLRLGWSHGDDETISDAQAIEWFTLDGIGKSPSRFDFVKLENLNGHYIREADNARLVELVWPLLLAKGFRIQDSGFTKESSLNPESLIPNPKERLLHGMPGLKARAKTLVELAHAAEIYVLPRPLPISEKAQVLLTEEGKISLRGLLPLLEQTTDWEHKNLEQLARTYAESNGAKLGKIAQPLRAALTGRDVSPGVFEVMEVLGKEETLARLKDIC